MGPVATAAHSTFAAHMAGHLLRGMAAPLVLVLGAPVTLALRALPVAEARTLTGIDAWMGDADVALPRGDPEGRGKCPRLTARRGSADNHLYKAD